MIYFNGTAFDVEVEELSRSYKKNKAYDVQTQDGIRHVKINNVKITLDLQFIVMEQDVYREMLSIFNTTEPYIDVIIEDEINGDLEFTAINPDVRDEVEFYDDKQVYWGSFSVTLEEK